jgi:serine/threonine protein phosphatase PrpC
LDLLEGALRDCFVELDKEILMSVQGIQVPEANTPYHEAIPNDTIPTTTSTAKTSSGEETKDPAEQETTHAEPQDDEDAGTTAIVVVATPEWIVCANAGDSRAVISKQGNKAVPLSYDHKPDDDDELKRIKAAGGYVSGGRVDGDLAVSRGLGDYRFKEHRTVMAGSEHGNKNDDDSMLAPDDQKVSPEPDIVVQTRNPDIDEFVIVACDGIWDVATNYECVKMVADIFAEGESDIGLVAEEVSEYESIFLSKSIKYQLI